MYWKPKKEDEKARNKKKSDNKESIKKDSIKYFEKKEREFLEETGKKGEKIDLVTGQVYKKNTHEKDYTPIKRYYNEEQSAFNQIFNRPPLPRPVSVLKKNPVIKSKLLVLCIELSYLESQIENMINLFIKQENPKFLRIILFKNGVYFTRVKFCEYIKPGEILDFIKLKKMASNTIVDTMGINNTLLFDAVDEAISTEEKKSFYPKVIVGEYDYYINDIQYVFVLSGLDRGSKTNKEQIQNMLKVNRAKNSNFHAVLTNFSNLPEVSSYGFRSIVTVNL